MRKSSKVMMIKFKSLTEWLEELVSKLSSLVMEMTLLTWATHGTEQKLTEDLVMIPLTCRLLALKVPFLEAKAMMSSILTTTRCPSRSLLP